MKAGEHLPASPLYPGLHCPVFRSCGCMDRGAPWHMCVYQGRGLGVGVGTGALQGRNEKLQRDLPPATVNPNVEPCLPILFGIWCQLLCWARLSLVWVLGSWVPCRWGSLWDSMHLSPPALPDPGFRDHPLHPCCQTAPLSVGPGAIGPLWIKAFASWEIPKAALPATASWRPVVGFGLSPGHPQPG